MTKWTEKVDEKRVDDMSTFLKVMSDRTRLRILVELMNGTLCVNHICQRVEMSQSAVSHQLAVLRQAGLVKTTKNGKTAVYSIADGHVRMILDLVKIHLEEDR